jgi:LacI family transcriptional regulator
MTSIPERLSLVNQATACIQDGISKGQWREWLPAERVLCETLQISRSTLRHALTKLKRNGIIKAVYGVGNRIENTVAAKSSYKISKDVAILTPEPLDRLRPAQTLWIDELRAMLSERGIQLHLINGNQYFRSRPKTSLDKLVKQRPHGCWILLLATASCQDWFANSGLPCIIAGSCHNGINLPFCDLDHRTACRHAAGMLITLGHRRLVFFAQKSPLAGDIESEQGFFEGVQKSSHPDVFVTAARHDATSVGITQTLKKLMSQPQRPTALVVPNALHYLAVVSGLSHLGWHIPSQVSVISRDDDTFLWFYTPEPSRYVVSSRAYARNLLHSLIEIVEGSTVSVQSSKIIPKFMRGSTIGPAVSTL